jgi:FkbM family methyltransferase
MMYAQISIIRRKLRGLAWMVFNKIENNGNARFEENGEKVFIENLFKIFKTSSKQRIVFDIGANIGEYSSMLLDSSQRHGVDLELHLFEPTKNCFKIISEKFESKNNVTPNSFGVSDLNTTAKIFYDKEQSGLASLYQRNLDSYNLELNQSEEIKLRRIDEYIEEKNIKHIDFIKIDIEGHELKAFDGFGKYLNSNFIDYIQFEYGGANLDSHSSLMEIYKFLENRGFSVAKMMTSGLELRKYSPFMDNFMYSNYVAVSNKVLEK